MEASGRTPASPFQPFHSLVLPFIACEPKREIEGVCAARGTIEERNRKEGEAGRNPASPSASLFLLWIRPCAWAPNRGGT